MIWLNGMIEKCDKETNLIIHQKDGEEIAVTAGNALKVLKGDFLKSASVDHYGINTDYYSLEIWLEGSGSENES